MFNNGKDFADYMGARLWDTSSTFRSHILRWANQIQTELAKEMRNYYTFKLKKMLPTSQEIINLSPQIPSVVSVAASSGGSLTDGTTYKVYITFVIYDQDNLKYMESVASTASAVVSPTGSNLTISLTNIDTYDGSTSIYPATIYRNVYLSKKASGDSDYGDPFHVGQIADNTTTTYSITAEATSTITPPSVTELLEVKSDNMYFEASSRYLTKREMSSIVRSDPGLSVTSTSPYSFDFYNLDSIYLYPKLDSTSSTAQKTLSYFVIRKPHEIFYDVASKLDMHLDAQMALQLGVTWLGYDFRDRSGKESAQQNYLLAKEELASKYKNKKGPSSILDVNGDSDGWFY